MNKFFIVLFLVVFSCFSMRINHFDEAPSNASPESDPYIFFNLVHKKPLGDWSSSFSLIKTWLMDCLVNKGLVKSKHKNWLHSSLKIHSINKKSLMILKTMRKPHGSKIYLKMQRLGLLKSPPQSLQANLKVKNHRNW